MSKPILLIDDEEKFAVMLQEILELNHFEAEYSLNPREALTRLQRENYDLVISDYKMPDLDGAEFLQEARKINPDLPVIMISGLMNMPELIKVANIGVTLVLEKPFKTEDLIEHVARFVRPRPGDEVTAQAMDMEASEINFQLGQVLVSYPSPARYLSDASNENKRFLEALWKTANNCRHLPFYAQRGAEVRLVAKEIMDWTDQDPEAEVVRFDLVDTKTEFTQIWVQEADPFPGVLVIDLRESSLDEGTLASLAQWIDFVESCGKDLSLSRLLYVLPMGARFEPDLLDIEDPLKALLSTECPVLLSLRERVQDAATYISRMLTEQEARIIGRDNLIRLLHYAWPGGYQELQSRINALRAELKGKEALSPDVLDSILADRSEDAASLRSSADLEGFLKRRQRDYILLHRSAGEDLRDTLVRLGIDGEDLDQDSIMNDRCLLFPHLLEDTNT